MTRGRTRVLAAVATALLAGAAGCTDADAGPGPEAPPERATGTETPPSPLAGCDALTAPPPDTDSAPTPGAGGDDRPPLPELALPCFTGGEPVSLSELAGPAVVNLWASWCPPCREELPALQRYADRATGQVHVLGVVTEDRRSAATALAEDLGITFPALEDRERQLLGQVDAVGLPATLFVDAAGRIAYLHQGGAIDEDTLREYTAEHLGVDLG